MQLRIEHADGSTDTLTAASSQITRSLDEQDRAEVQVYRDEWMAIEDSLVPRTAKLYLDVAGSEEFGGRLDDTDTQDETVRVRINSPEIDAAEAEPTGENVIYQNAGDDEIAADQIMAVPTLMPGTVTEQASALSYSASYASRSKVLYDLRSMTGSEFRYNADFTVDYVDRLGTDKSGSITLGPAQQNVGQQFSKQIDVRENVTHVQGLGAQSGPDQVQATGVADSYDGGRKIWKRYENKEVYQESRLQNIVDELANEYDGEPRSLEVTCTIYPNQIGADIALGDSVQVTYSEEDIDRTLRIKELTRRFSESAGHVLDLVLSNRFLTRENRTTKRNDDLQRFNRGYQGFVDRNQTTSGWNPAGDGIPQTLEIPVWPDDIVSEKRVELTVQGRAWRSPIDTQGHSHQVTLDDHTHGVSISDSATSDPVPPSNMPEVFSVGGTESDVDFQGEPGYLLRTETLDGSYGTPIAGWPYMIHAVAGIDSGESDEFHNARLIVRAPNLPGSPYWTVTGSTPSTTKPFTRTEGTGVITRDLAGEELEFRIMASYPNASTQDISWNYLVYAADPHTHDVNISDTTTTSGGGATTETTDEVVTAEPSVVSSFNGNQYYPTDVEIQVNGSTLTTIAGNNSADWQETVDLAGELQAGGNTITAEPTGQRGSINLILSSELFRRGPQSN